MSPIVVGPGTKPAWEGAYRRVVEVHYALAEAGRVDEELHHWCLDKLDDLLRFIDQAEQRDRSRVERQGGHESVS